MVHPPMPPALLQPSARSRCRGCLSACPPARPPSARWACAPLTPMGICSTYSRRARPHSSTSTSAPRVHAASRPLQRCLLALLSCFQLSCQPRRPGFGQGGGKTAGRPGCRAPAKLGGCSWAIMCTLAPWPPPACAGRAWATASAHGPSTSRALGPSARSSHPCFRTLSSERHVRWRG